MSRLQLGPKPDVPPNGIEWPCPNCRHSAVYQRTDVLYPCYIKVRPFAHGRLTNQNVLVHLAGPDRSAPCLQCRTRYVFLAQAFPCESVRRKSGLLGGREAALSGEIVLKSQLTTQAYGPTLCNAVL